MQPANVCQTGVLSKDAPRQHRVAPNNTPMQLRRCFITRSCDPAASTMLQCNSGDTPSQHAPPPPPPTMLQCRGGATAGPSPRPHVCYSVTTVSNSTQYAVVKEGYFPHGPGPPGLGPVSATAPMQLRRCSVTTCATPLARNAQMQLRQCSITTSRRRCSIVARWQQLRLLLCSARRR